MKKLTTFVLFVFAMLMVMAPMTFAAETDDIVDLYPNDKITDLQTTYGDSNWDLVYNGHRYHFVRGAARYVSKLTNKDTYVAADLPGLSFNAFAALWINDTERDVEFTTTNARTDLTTVVHRMYAYFDENGKMYMFEDHISTYFITNDGTAEAEDWRFSTEQEIADYNEADAEAKPENMLSTHVRVVLDELDDDGYKIEPLGYLTWYHRAYNAETNPVKSILLVDEPNSVSIPAGHTVVSFGTLDRGTANAKTTEWIKSLPYAMIQEEAETAQFTFDAPIVYTGVSSLDKDPSQAGIQMVAPYRTSFDFPSNLTAAFSKMTVEENNNLVFTDQYVDFKVEISKDGELLETINYVYSGSGTTYTKNAQTVIDTNVFGDEYDVKFIAQTESGLVNEVNATLIVGVIPPRFTNVKNRASDEGVPLLDLLYDVKATAFDANSQAVDRTENINIKLPEGFNQYNPQPGVYDIELSFSYDVVFEGTIDDTLTITYGDDVTEVTKDKVDTVTVLNNGTAYGRFAIFTDTTAFRAATGIGAWGVLVLVIKDNKVITVSDRKDGRFLSDSQTVTSGWTTANAEAWQQSFTIPDGAVVLVTFGAANIGTYSGIQLDADVSVTGINPTVVKTVEASETFKFTIDDITAPTVIVKEDNVKVDPAIYTNRDTAVLANIIAFDNATANNELDKYVSSYGGLDLNKPGTYNVEVTVGDMAGNQTIVEFKVTVIEPTPNRGEVEELQDIIDELTEENENLKDQLQDLENELVDTKDQLGNQIEDLEKTLEQTKNEIPQNTVSVLMAVLMSLGAAVLAFGGSVVLFFVKKK